MNITNLFQLYILFLAIITNIIYVELGLEGNLYEALDIDHSYSIDFNYFSTI